MRLTKETAKDRIEVVAVPVGNSIEKTVHKTFLEFQTLSAENLICHIHICIHDMGVLRSFLTVHCKYFRRIVFMVLWVLSIKFNYVLWTKFITVFSMLSM